MKLYISTFAPNPRRVTMFIAEKGIGGIENVMIDLGAGEHRSASFIAKNPLGAGAGAGTRRWPRAVRNARDLHLPGRAVSGAEPDGRGLRGARLHRDGRPARRAAPVRRHRQLRAAHPSRPGRCWSSRSFPSSARRRARRCARRARWLDGELANHPYVAGQRFTVADITAFCALEFARGLMKFRPGAEGMTNLQEWRDRIAARPTAGRP